MLSTFHHLIFFNTSNLTLDLGFHNSAQSLHFQVQRLNPVALCS